MGKRLLIKSFYFVQFCFIFHYRKCLEQAKLLDGKSLHILLEIKDTAPEYYHASMDKHFQLPFPEMLALFAALTQLEKVKKLRLCTSFIYTVFILFNKCFLCRETRTSKLLYILQMM